ncbi:MAG: bifunctional 23S rRNA (guanine(2069)-N(7))-methyltransferase RlmK/23S rRNA (guanine(2445)-N(2))-methyltransferase RlmL [Proteobacteria bacterium]|nr:bifunctional 23S rRNA (guanine(2069)-N(7))-methyltransferase RlmK/23S rRNA (guanine(2445)-N(2))-methyltransferase RlmL [Pseudomonadota bacterium]
MDKIILFFATAPKGVESLLLDELIRLGATRPKLSRAGAYFQGDLELGYRACLWLRTANRVLLPISTFPADTPDELYDGIKKITWLDHLEPDGTLAVDFQSSQSAINHSRYGAQRVKDAVVDQFLEQFDIRPSVDLTSPDIRINLYLHKNEATVSLDLAGQSLHKRGYRTEKGAAPLKENLAAAILMRAGWPEIAENGGGLIDPMCGSGTLPIEAALMAADSAPGLLRDYYGFFKWKRHRPDIWTRLVDEAEKRESEGLSRLPPIVGYDSDSKAIAISHNNLERIGLKGFVHFEKRELADSNPHPRMKQVPGLVVMNPPYGERIGREKELRPLYSNLGRCLKDRFHGWKASLFTGNAELGKGMGIRANKMYTLYNGAIKCRLLNFEVETEWFVDDARRLSTRKSPIKRPVRMKAETEMFSNRLRKNIKRLKKWLKNEDITCFRAYDADLPEYAVAVDVYEKWIHVQEYKAPDTVDPEKSAIRLNDILAVLPGVLEVPSGNVFLKTRRPQKGKSQYGKLESEEVFYDVRENGCRFLVNFTDYLDTGLFLDHRLTRKMIGDLAKGKRFLNLFSYTGTATVYAAKGGARSTTSVDMSRAYLDWAKKNLALNGFSRERHFFESADCLDWIRNDKRKYDLIFLDPPTFSNSKRSNQTFDAQRDHVQLINRVAGLLENDGILIFSNNFRRFKMDIDALSGFQVVDLSKTTLPPDFKRTPRIHNCWKIEK